MFEIDLKSRKAICDQIADNIKELIVAGVIAPDDKLPSVRELAGELTVNPNTVQKAYGILERQGFIYIAKGRGTFASKKDEIKPSEDEKENAVTLLREGARKLYLMGTDRNTAKELFDRILDERSDWK